MSLARRTLAVLLHLVLLHATLLAGGSACGSAVSAHGAHGAAASADRATAGAHAAHGDDAHEQAAAAVRTASDGENHSPVGAHGTTHCGLALGCGAAVVTTRLTGATEALTRATRVRSAEPGTLASVSTAPGTPPPRG